MSKPGLEAALAKYREIRPKPPPVPNSVIPETVPLLIRVAPVENNPRDYTPETLQEQYHTETDQQCTDVTPEITEVEVKKEANSLPAIYIKEELVQVEIKQETDDVDALALTPTHDGSCDSPSESTAPVENLVIDVNPQNMVMSRRTGRAGENSQHFMEYLLPVPMMNYVTPPILLIPPEPPVKQKKKSVIEELMVKRNPDVWKCELCNKIYKCQSSLYKHSWKHRNKEHECKECHEKFATRNKLTAHISVKKYECDLCPEEFICHNALLVHNRTHVTNNKYKCDQCEKAFTTKNHLIVHKSWHAGIKPFECTECPEKFSYRGQLRTHMRTHTGDLFECNICHKKYLSNDYLKQHYIIHSGVRNFACDQCDKKFFFKPQLRHHIRAVHMKVKPFTCEQCHINFSFKSQLTDHTRAVHEREKRLICDVCGKQFYFKTVLNKHMATHGKEDD